jgi:hypothetical protein
MTKQISKTQEAYNTMRKVPLVINAVGSGHSLISQVTHEGSRCSFENAKWYVLESPLRQTQSRNGFVDDFCSSKPMQKPVRQESSGKLLENSTLREKDFRSSMPMQKPVRQESSGKLLEHSIHREKRNASMTNAVFDSDINVKKSPDLGYWAWHDTDSPQDLTWNSYASPKDRLSSPTSGGGLRDTRWAWSGSSSRPSLESTMELSPERKQRTRLRASSMPLMMPQRKSSVQDKLNLPSMPLMMPQRKSSVQDKLNLSRHERRTGYVSSLVHNKRVHHFPRHLKAQMRDL